MTTSSLESGCASTRQAQLSSSASLQRRSGWTVAEKLGRRTIAPSGTAASKRPSRAAGANATATRRTREGSLGSGDGRNASTNVGAGGASPFTRIRPFSAQSLAGREPGAPARGSANASIGSASRATTTSTSVSRFVGIGNSSLRPKRPSSVATAIRYVWDPVGALASLGSGGAGVATSHDVGLSTARSDPKKTPFTTSLGWSASTHATARSAAPSPVPRTRATGTRRRRHVPPAKSSPRFPSRASYPNFRTEHASASGSLGIGPRSTRPSGPEVAIDERPPARPSATAAPATGEPDSSTTRSPRVDCGSSAISIVGLTSRATSSASLHSAKPGACTVSSAHPGRSARSWKPPSLDVRAAGSRSFPKNSSAPATGFCWESTTRPASASGSASRSSPRSISGRIPRMWRVSEGASPSASARIRAPEAVGDAITTAKRPSAPPRARIVGFPRAGSIDSPRIVGFATGEPAPSTAIPRRTVAARAGSPPPSTPGAAVSLGIGSVGASTTAIPTFGGLRRNPTKTAAPASARIARTRRERFTESRRGVGGVARKCGSVAKSRGAYHGARRFGQRRP